jgi:hypothetical protein
MARPLNPIIVPLDRPPFRDEANMVKLIKPVVGGREYAPEELAEMRCRTQAAMIKALSIALIFMSTLTIVVSVMLLYSNVSVAEPKFADCGDDAIAVDRVQFGPVLVVERSWSYKGWRYMVAAPFEDQLVWRDEAELWKPTDVTEWRKRLRKQLTDRVLHMNSSSTDRTISSDYKIHVADRGSWSIPIVDGQVTTPVEKAK